MGEKQTEFRTSSGRKSTCPPQRNLLGKVLGVFHDLSILSFRRSPVCCPSPRSAWMSSQTARRSGRTLTPTSSTASTAARTSSTTSPSTAKQTPSSWAKSAPTSSPAARARTCTSNWHLTSLRRVIWSSRAPATRWCPSLCRSSTCCSATWSSCPTLRSSAPCPFSTWRWRPFTPWRTSSCFRRWTRAASAGSCCGTTSSRGWRRCRVSSSNAGIRRGCSATRPSESGWCGARMERAQTSCVSPGERHCGVLTNVFEGGGKTALDAGLSIYNIVQYSNVDV